MRGGIGKTLGELAVALVGLLSGAALVQADTGALIDRLEQTIPVRMIGDGVAGAVVVVVSDCAPVWAGAFGDADSGTGRAMTEDALCRVESISKLVTAWGVMRLVEMGRLDLDQPMIDCLVSWRPPQVTPQLTARQLLRHSAGIGPGDYAARYAPDAPRPSLPDHLTQDFRMIGAPGNAFAYSDTGYNLLELVIEDCSGEDFAAFMQRGIFAPLGMKAAHFDWTDAELRWATTCAGGPFPPMSIRVVDRVGCLKRPMMWPALRLREWQARNRSCCHARPLRPSTNRALLSLVCSPLRRMDMGWAISPKPFLTGARPSGTGGRGMAG